MTSTLCAMMKNEAPYILEWIVYHRLIGFDRIVIYENDSDDQTPALLRKCVDLGILHGYVPWKTGSGSPQLAAYIDASKKCGTDWIMFLDADEFLNIKSRAPVDQFLSGFSDEISSVSVNWRLFGSNGEQTYRPDLVLNRFTRASLLESGVNRHVKTFFRPQLLKEPHPHAPEMLSGSAVLASGAPLTMSINGLSDAADFSVAQVNHYFSKSREEYEMKRRRGCSMRDDADAEKYEKYTDNLFQSHDQNDEEDTSILWSVQAVAESCRELESEGANVNASG